MSEQQKVSIGVTAAVVAVLIIAIIATFSLRIYAYGAIKAISCEVYGNAEGTIIVREIDWGKIGPGEKAQITLWIENTGNSPSNFTLLTENWAPAEAANFLTLSWDYNGSAGSRGSHKSQPFPRRGSRDHGHNKLSL